MATVDRVLPWRRHHSAPIEELDPLLTAYRSRHPKAPVALINKAYEAAREAHQQQHRSSGESYINHPIAVARIVADLGLDEVSLAQPFCTTPWKTPTSRLTMLSVNLVSK